jgi:type I restriction enzyme S subunit
MPLGEFVTLQRGHDLPEEQRRLGSVPILGSFGITGWHDEAKAFGPGVTVGRSGASFGVVSYSSTDYWPLNTALYVIDFHENDPRFAYYFLGQFDFRRYNSGSAQPSLNRNFIHPAPVIVPPLDEQRAIAGLLSGLDDKIQLNRRMAETLEAMARALFRSWFIDFDPVRAKAEGCPTGLPDDLADLFPDSFGDDRLPQGWDSTVASIGRLSRSTVQPEDVKAGTPYIGLEHLERGHLVVERWGRAEDVNSVKTMFHNGDLLFGKLRPYFHKVAIAPVSGICSSDIFVFRPTDDIPGSFLYLTFSEERFVETASNASSGTRMPRADWNYMAEQSAVLPPPEILKAFDAITSPMIATMQARAEQSRTLASLRGALLPKLISGELRITDGEKSISAA